jgi:hypothetical protein
MSAPKFNPSGIPGFVPPAMPGLGGFPTPGRTPPTGRQQPAPSGHPALTGMGARNQQAHLAPQQQRVALPPQHMQGVRDIAQHGAHMQQGQKLNGERQQVMRFLARPGLTGPQKQHLQNKLSVLNQQIAEHRGQAAPTSGTGGGLPYLPSAPTDMPRVPTHAVPLSGTGGDLPYLPSAPTDMPRVPTHAVPLSGTGGGLPYLPSAPTDMPRVPTHPVPLSGTDGALPHLPSTAGLGMPPMSQMHYTGGPATLPRSASAPQLSSPRGMGAAPMRRTASQPQMQKAPIDPARVRAYMNNMQPQAIAQQLRGMGVTGPLPSGAQLKANMNAFIQLTANKGLNPTDVIKKDPGIYLQVLTGKKYPAAPPTSAAARNWLNQMGGAQNLSGASNWNQQKLETLAGALRQEGKNATVNPSGDFNQNWEAVWKGMSDHAAKTGGTPQQALENFVTQKPEQFLEVMNRSGGGGRDSLNLPDVPTNIPAMPTKAEPQRAAPRRQAVAA